MIRFPIKSDNHYKCDICRKTCHHNPQIGRCTCYPKDGHTMMQIVLESVIMILCMKCWMQNSNKLGR